MSQKARIMLISIESIQRDLQAIREKAPLVHNITNYVVMNSSANALLALGASPVMAHAEDEAAEMVELAGALVLNIGTLSSAWIRAMHTAAERATALGVPIVLDPVGAGATSYRTKTAYELLATYRPAILRGNASEIAALAQVAVRAQPEPPQTEQAQTAHAQTAHAQTKGVDSTLHAEAAADAARQLAASFGCTVCVSGEIDHIVPAQGKAHTTKIHNGHPLMAKVTGMGCAASALCGAFAAVNTDFSAATAHAMAVMGIAGQLAAQGDCGPGTLQINFLDALYDLDAAQISKNLKLV